MSSKVVHVVDGKITEGLRRGETVKPGWCIQLSVAVVPQSAIVNEPQVDLSGGSFPTLDVLGQSRYQGEIEEIKRLASQMIDTLFDQAS